MRSIMPLKIQAAVMEKTQYCILLRVTPHIRGRHETPARSTCQQSENCNKSSISREAGRSPRDARNSIDQMNARLYTHVRTKLPILRSRNHPSRTPTMSTARKFSIGLLALLAAVTAASTPATATAATASTANPASAGPATAGPAETQHPLHHGRRYRLDAAEHLP